MCTSFDAKAKLMRLSNEEYVQFVGDMQDIPYKARVEPLMYAIVGTKHDLAIMVNVVSQFISRLEPMH